VGKRTRVGKDSLHTIISRHLARGIQKKKRGGLSPSSKKRNEWDPDNGEARETGDADRSRNVKKLEPDGYEAREDGAGVVTNLRQGL